LSCSALWLASSLDLELQLCAILADTDLKELSYNLAPQWAKGKDSGMELRIFIKMAKSMKEKYI